MAHLRLLTAITAETSEPRLGRPLCYTASIMSCCEDTGAGAIVWKLAGNVEEAGVSCLAATLRDGDMHHATGTRRDNRLKVGLDVLMEWYIVFQTPSCSPVQPETSPQKADRKRCKIPSQITLPVLRFTLHNITTT